MAGLKDIAKVSGFSQSTISRVLNNDPTLVVSTQTRKTIVEHANNLGYKMKKKNKGLQFAIINWYDHDQEIIDPYYFYIRKSVTNMCDEEEIEIITLFSNDKIENLVDVDGIIAIGKFSDNEIKRMELYTSNIVFVDSSPDELKYDSVVVDFKKVSEEIVEMFYKDGFKNVGYIGGIEYTKNMKIIDDYRYLSFVNKTKELGIYNEHYIKQDSFTSESGYKLAKEIMSSKVELPIAIFCANDVIALGANRAVIEMGYKVPEQVSLIGFNDIPLAKYFTPSLSTIKVYVKEMGTEALRLAIDGVKEDKTTSKKIVMPTKLIIRESYQRKDVQ